MAINWAKVRSAMTQTPDYNPGAYGAGSGYRTTVGPKTGTPYRGSGYGSNQYNWGRNFSSRPNAGGGADYMSTIGTPSKAKTVTKSNPNAFANARALMTSPAAYGDEEEGGIMEVIKEKSGEAFNDAKTMGSNLTTPMMEMGKRALEGIGGLSEGIGRGIRLHNAYKDKYGSSDQWKSDKQAMMTGKDRDFYNKYMRLADLTSDQDLARQYRETAETAWRNQQTTDRLAQTMGFEGYDDPKYNTPGMPGYERMKNNPYIQSLMAAETETPIGIQYEDPDMLNEILPGEPGVDLRPYAGMETGIDYEAMGLAPDPENDLLYGEPGFGEPRIVPKIKPEPYNPYRDEDYGAPLPYSGSDGLYPDEKYGAPTKGFTVKRKRSSFPFSGLGGSTLYLDYGDTGVELPYAMPEVEEEIVEEQGPSFWERYFDANPDREGFQLFNFN